MYQSPKRIFISFAVEDKVYRSFLVAQAKNNKSPFEFVDMSVKTPWDNMWKTRCRTKIKGCHGMIALLSPNTLGADGARWEIKCAIEEGVPVRGMYIFRDKKCRVPSEIESKRIVYWGWDNIVSFLNSL